MNADIFHPIIARWFQNRFGEPTEPQRLGWPEIVAGRNTLIAAPTGSGKTLAAFLVCIDWLLRQAIDGTLGDETQVVYVSPLKALSNDVRRNLEVPLREIREVAAAEGIELPEIRVLVRTGDTPPAERQAMTRRPPHILVTTPESLYLVLTAAKGREILRTVRTVIVDEIHALARDKRGSHLTLSLERLAALCAAPPVRIGLSATVRPVDEIARFLVGQGSRQLAVGSSKADEPEPNSLLPTANSLLPSIVDVGHVRELDLGIEVPPSELSAVCSIEQWAEIYARIIELIQAHRSTLIFVNTRRLSERVAHNLRQQLGDDSVAAHHGSLSREIRLAAEERLKNGQLKAIVATASLELGIDIGFIDLVCQIGSPRSIATFLQRVGRSGHSLGRVPKGRLFPLTRDELIECLALVRAVRARRLDAVEIPVGPLDILAQQIVATVACEEWSEDELFELCRGAWPYRNLSRTDFDAVVEMMSEGVAGGRRRGAYLHRDRVNGRLRARRGARIAAATSGGAIPEVGDYRVVTETDRTFVGSVNEDFAIESISGDVFILGNTSWRIAYVRGGEVVVNDAHGQPATIPFWLGEAPGRTVELSAEVSRLREEVARLAERDRGSRIEDGGSKENSGRVAGVESSSPQPVADTGGLPLVPCGPTPSRWDSEAPATLVAWLKEDCGVDAWAAHQAVNYIAAQQAAIGLVPTQQRIVFERFFDESGGMQLVIHAPFGSRINRAWGLALRKRFCRSFDFELQAAADDNGIVLALGPQHSFPIEQMFKMLRPDNGEHMLTQALMAVPLFPTRFRWNAARSLAILRFSGGKKVPFHLQRFRSDDLLTAVFPACTACLENRPEDLPIPDHPLVRQTIWDCLHEAMDVDRWVELLRDIEAGRVELVARDTREPSPFSHQLLNANPYAFLDGAPLEERRTRAVSMRRSFTVESVRDLGRLDPDAIAQVRAEAWPLVRDADELHDTLLSMSALPATEGEPWLKWFGELVASGRATEIRRTGNSNGQADSCPKLWIAAERWPLIRAAFPDAEPNPPVSLPKSLDTEQEASQAWVALVRGRLECIGPVTASTIAQDLGLPMSSVQAALEALEGEGFVLRGQFEEGSRELAVGSRAESESSLLPTADSLLPSEAQWCERRLLARIHRLTLDGLRRQIQPVEVADFFRFLLEHHHLTHDTRLAGRRALVDVIEQLQGFEIPAGAWEHEILPARLAEYDSAWLDELSLSGHVAWGRLQPPRRGDDAPARALLTRVVPIALGFREDMNWLVPPARSTAESPAGAGAATGAAGGLEVKLRSSAQAVYDELVKRGALFAHDLQSATGLLPTQLEEALRELAAVGLVTADGFAAIRSIASRDIRNGGAGRRLARWGRLTTRANSTGGRWSLFVRSDSSASGEVRAERWAALLLRRYGVVFRDLLARESAAPPWRELARVYRRLEARGEIRGGRFVAGVAGEQFGTSEAVDRLRKVRDEMPATTNASHAGAPEDLSPFRPSRPFGHSEDNESGNESPHSKGWLVVSACDPLNLFGILTPGPRVPAMRGNRLLLHHGRLIASIQGGKILFHEDVESAEKDEWVRWMKLSGLARMRHESVKAAGESNRVRHAPKELAR